jgi:hypothetical protein
MKFILEYCQLDLCKWILIDLDEVYTQRKPALQVVRVDGQRQSEVNLVGTALELKELLVNRVDVRLHHFLTCSESVIIVDFLLTDEMTLVHFHVNIFLLCEIFSIANLLLQLLLDFLLHNRRYCLIVNGQQVLGLLLLQQKNLVAVDAHLVDSGEFFPGFRIHCFEGHFQFLE